MVHSFENVRRVIIKTLPMFYDIERVYATVRISSLEQENTEPMPDLDGLIRRDERTVQFAGQTDPLVVFTWDKGNDAVVVRRLSDAGNVIAGTDLGRVEIIVDARAYGV